MGRPPTHGMSRTSYYDVWMSLRRRCYDPRVRSYPNYGGRGITVCERWRNSFEAFMQDMGPRPPGYQIDRIDNDGPYSPENCRWVTVKEQRNNQRPIRGGYHVKRHCPTCTCKLMASRAEAD